MDFLLHNLNLLSHTTKRRSRDYKILQQETNQDKPKQNEQIVFYLLLYDQIPINPIKGEKKSQFGKDNILRKLKVRTFTVIMLYILYSQNDLHNNSNFNLCLITQRNSNQPSYVYRVMGNKKLKFFQVESFLLYLQNQKTSSDDEPDLSHVYANIFL